MFHVKPKVNVDPNHHLFLNQKDPVMLDIQQIKGDEQLKQYDKTASDI